MKRILVIEDNQEVRENICEILALSGYEALAAENGKVGVARAITDKPDLILCDVMMPELDGYGVLFLLAKNPETALIPFIYLTAKTEVQDYRKAMGLGADDYLTKPFDDTDLLKAIEIRLAKEDKRRDASPSTTIVEEVNTHFEDGQTVLDQLVAAGEEMQAVKKQVLYAEGQMPRRLYYIKEGNVKTFRTTADGKEFIHSMYGAGNFLGYTALLEDEVYAEGAVCLDNVTLSVIPKDAFVKAVKENPKVANQIIGLLAKHLAEQEEKMVTIAYQSLRKRVIETLLELKDRIGEVQATGTLISISREDFAKAVGTATESAIRILTELKDDKLIELGFGTMLVKEPEKLARLKV